MSEQQLVVRVEPEHDTRVKVFVPWQRKDWIQQIRSLPNRAWNKGQQYWSVPKNEATFQQLIQLFGKDLKIAAALASQKEVPTIDKKTAIKLPKTCIMATPEHLAKSKGTYQKRTGIITIPKNSVPAAKFFKTIQQGERTFKVFIGEQIILEKANNEWLVLWVSYDKKGWIEVVKNIPGRKWETEGKYWCIPYVKDSLKRLWKLIGPQHFQYSFEINPNIPAEFKIKRIQKRKAPKFNLNDMQKRALVAFEEKLMLEHKAWRTIKTYKGLFTHFLAYFPNVKPSSISKEQIEAYMLYKIQGNVSDSQLNQLINCFNCFFIRILMQKEKVVKLERPKKKKKLPNVFSLAEIERLLKACVNLKHKSMLILVYSGGLRRSEVLNLRVEDLNFDRKTVFIKNAKGGKDRFTFLADLARKYLVEYLKQYEPRYYLFEGQMRGRYGESSLQKIFDTAKKYSKVTPNVTLHGLRHSFATHLVEKRVPLHVVQELLGHNSIKTTEIYLHISNKFRKELKSPLDDLSL